MIIKIDDKLSPKERKTQLKLLPIIYALKLHDQIQYKAAAWLGMSARTIRWYFKRYPQLRQQRELTDNEELELEEYKQKIMKSLGYRYASNKNAFLNIRLFNMRKKLSSRPI